MENLEKLDDQQLEAAIEAILFAMGDSVELSRMAKALETEEKRVKKTIAQMMENYKAQNRGIEIIELENAYQLCTKSSAYDYLIRLAKQPRKVTLTDVVMETLSIIAYKQPVTRLEIEKIRGVKCDHAINKLLEYQLIKEVGRLDAPGKPLLFGTTEQFLRHFGVNSVEDLPVINPVQMEDFKAEAEEEISTNLESV